MTQNQLEITKKKTDLNFSQEDRKRTVPIPVKFPVQLFSGMNKLGVGDLGWIGASGGIIRGEVLRKGMWVFCFYNIPRCFQSGVNPPGPYSQQAPGMEKIQGYAPNAPKAPI